jgi:hypothetical protein
MRWAKRIITVVALVTAAVGLWAAGHTYAWWNAEAGAGLADLTAGNLNLGYQGTAWWVLEEDDDILTGEDEESLAALHSLCGRELFVARTYTATLAGDHLKGRLDVAWSGDGHHDSFQLKVDNKNFSSGGVLIGQGDHTVTVTAQYALPECDPWDATSSVTYAGFTVTLSQVWP